MTWHPYIMLQGKLYQFVSYLCHMHVTSMSYVCQFESNLCHICATFKSIWVIYICHMCLICFISMSHLSNGYMYKSNLCHSFNVTFFPFLSVTFVCFWLWARLAVLQTAFFFYPPFVNFRYFSISFIFINFLSNF